MNKPLHARPLVILGGFLAILVVLGLGLFSWQVVRYVKLIRSGAPDPFFEERLQASVTRKLAQTPLINLDLSRIESGGDDPVLGNPDAKIRVVEFIDYTCPFSRQSASEVRAFMDRHPTDVALILRYFPLESLNPNAMDAAIAARCVYLQKNDRIFWRYHDMLFAYQDKLRPDKLKDYARLAGANVSNFETCVASLMPEPHIQASVQDGLAAGVRGTPTFFVNGTRFPGALNLQALEAIYKAMASQNKL